MIVPVVMLHRGKSDYVEYSIETACRNNEVIYIGDRKPDYEGPNFEFVDLHSLVPNEDVEKFSRDYVHLNTTPESYEIFCYTRWLYLRQYMKEEGLDCVFYIDSDVMLFTNVSSEWRRNYSHFDMTLIHRTAAVSSFMTMQGLDNFCNMMLHIYGNKSSYDFAKIASHYEVRQKFGLPGGVCDMTLFEYFHYHSHFGGGPGRVGEMMHPTFGAVYDHNINVPDNDFEMRDGIKAVHFVGKLPYVRNTRSHLDVRFLSLHCQGDAKRYMKDIYEHTR